MLENKELGSVGCMGCYLQHYPTRDPARKEQVLINSRGVTVFTTDHLNELNTEKIPALQQ